MAIDFPNSPTNGQTYTVGTKTWTYNSSENQWLLSSVSPDSGVLTTKGDLLTRSSSAITRLGVGSNGDMLVADSGTTSGLRWQGQTNTGRNLLINGAMQVHQRGTSKTAITGVGYYTADRWAGGVGGIGTWTQSVEDDGPTGSGLRKSLKMLCTTADASPAAGEYLVIEQALEGFDCQRIKKGTSSAEQLTLSFWVKANVTGTYICELLDGDNSRSISATYSVSSSATWERKTITFPADTTGTLNNDNGVSLSVLFWLGAGSTYSSGTLNSSWASTVSSGRAAGQTNLAAATNNYWQITGVQLEVGPVATGFDFEPYETTLRKCQRYYYRATSETAYGYCGYGNAYTTTLARISIFPPVTMRTIPTSVDYSGVTLQDGGGGNFAVTSITGSGNGVINSGLAVLDVAVASGLTGFRNYALAGNNNTGHYVGLSAEL